MNNKGFGVVEFAAWIIVVTFVAKLITVSVIGESVLMRKNKLYLKEYENINLVLNK